jgi:hypothetical protein
MKNKTVINKWTGSAMLAGMSLMSIPAFAQDAENMDNGVSAPDSVEQQQPVDNQSGQSGRLPITVSAGVSEQFNADIDDGGSFSITRVKTGVSVPVRLNEDFKLSTSVRYEFDSYNFDDIDAWENINTLSAASILSWRMNDNWTTYGGGFVKMSAESGADLSDGTTGGGLLGFNYKVDDTLTLGAGLAVVGQIEDDASVLPLITAKWKFADNWRLDVGLSDVATTGYGAKLNWIFDQEFEFGLGAQFHKSRFRIKSNDEVAQEQSATLYVDATWHASPKIDFNGFIGIAAGGKLKVDDSSGNELTDTDYDPAPIIGVRALVRF